MPAVILAQLRHALRAISARYDASNPPVTLRQLQVLQALVEKGPMIQAQLGKACGMDRASTSDILARMDASGLITRTRDEKTVGRPMTAKVTTAGRAAKKKGDLVMDEAVRWLLRFVPAQDLPHLRKGLAGMAGAPLPGEGKARDRS